MRTIIAPALILTLAGCGLGKGGEDFAIAVEKSPDRVKAVLGSASTAGTSIPLTGIRFDVESSNPGEVIYSIPTVEVGGKQRDPAIIRLVLEPGKDGKGTVIHAHVDVPPIRVMLGKANMVLSENKVETVLAEVLKATFKSGSTASSREISELLAGVAIAGNSNLQARLNAAARNDVSLQDLIDEGVIDIPASDENAGSADLAAPDSAAGVAADNEPDDPYADAQAQDVPESSGEEF